MNKIYTLLIILTVLTITSCTSNNPPDFTDINGSAIHMSDYKGRIVLINVFTTWCSYCSRLRPVLEEIAKENKDVVLIGAAVDNPELVRKYIAENRIDYPVFLTTKPEMLEKFAKVNMFPSVFVIDRDSNYRFPVYGALPKEIYLDFIKRADKPKASK